MEHRTIWKKVLRIAVIAVASILLAYFTEQVADHYPIETPGESFARQVVPIPPRPNELTNLGKSILIAFAVDSVCYFVFICGVYVMIGKSRHKYSD